MEPAVVSWRGFIESTSFSGFDLRVMNRSGSGNQIVVGDAASPRCWRPLKGLVASSTTNAARYFAFCFGFPSFVFVAGTVASPYHIQSVPRSHGALVGVTRVRR